MFTEEMLLAGAKALFEAEVTMADWHKPEWREFKDHCFKRARLVLAAALAVPPATRETPTSAHPSQNSGAGAE